MKKMDCKLIFELDRNARQSNARIARAVGTSKQAVGYRMNKLFGTVIKQTLAIYDLAKLGLILHKIYLRLVGASEEDEIRILNHLANHRNVAWLVRTEGIYDIACAFHTKDLLELNDALREFEEEYGGFISERVVNRVVSGEFFHRDYLVEGSASGFRNPVVFESRSSARSLDDSDWAILAALARDARTHVVDVAKKVPIGADAVSRRIRLLETAGVIRNYIVVLDDEAMGQLHYKVLLKVGKFPSSVEGRFLEFCRVHPNITFYNKNIGAWDLEIDLEVQRSAAFREIMRELKREFADSIREYFSLMVYDVRKFDFLPMHD